MKDTKNIFGKLKLIISKKFDSIKTASQNINDLNIVGYNVTLLTADGKVYKLDIHDHEIVWTDESDI
jgi:hypothetical protein